MNKVIKIAAVIASICWAVCIAIALLKPDESFRYEFIVSTSILILTTLFFAFGEKENDRHIKGSYDKQGSDTEHNDNG